MGYLGNIKKQYAINLFQSLIPAYVIERLFWQARGIGVQGVVWCEIIYSMTVTLLEIPSGILSDKLGRKRLLVIAGILDILEFVVIFNAHSFWMFGLAVFFAGVGQALYSGSQHALLYDSLLTEQRQGDYEKLLGRLSAIDMTGHVAAALSGGVLARIFSFEFNYIVSIFSKIAAFAVFLTLKEPPRLTKTESETPSGLRAAKQALALFKSQPLVVLYCASGMVLGASLGYLDEFWQLLMEDIGVPVIFFGVISTLTLLPRIPGGLFAHKLKGRFSYRAILNIVLLVNAVGYIGVTLTRSVFCLVPMIAVFLAAGVVEPLVSGYLHHRAESHMRATAESFASLGLRLVSMPIGLIFGAVSTRLGVFAGFLPLGLLCLAWFAAFQVLHGGRGGRQAACNHKTKLFRRFTRN